MKRAKGPRSGELRRRAKKRLSTAGGDKAVASPGSGPRLLHELQIHQVELELQNEELQQTRTALEESLARYASLYESAPIGYLTLGRDRLIRQVNLTGARLLGLARARLVGGRLDRLLAVESRPIFETFIAKLFAGESADCAVAIRPEDGAPVILELTGTVTEDGQECRVVAADISQRRHAEVALWSAHARLRRFVDANIVGVVIADAAGTVVDANDYYLELIDHTREELERGKVDWRAITPPEWLPADERAIVELRARGTCTPYEKEYLRRDGTRVAVLLADALLPGPEEQIAAFVLDLTERKRAEVALRESESRLREAQELARLGYWTWDVETGVVEWSSQVFKIFGLDPLSFTPHIDSILALSPWPEDHERDQELIRKATASRQQGSYEQRFLRPDGSIGYYQSTFRGKYDARGKLVSIVGTVLDVTQQRQAESAVRESEALLRGILDNMQDAYVRTDRDGRFVMVSPSAARIYGYGSPEDMIGSLSLACYVDEADREALLQQLNASGHVTDYIGQSRKHDGSTFWVSLNAQLLRDSQGNVVGTEGVVRDITERKQAEMKREQLEAQLRQAQKMEGIGRLAGGVAHDFNNCLNVIQGFTRVCLGQSGEGDPLADHLGQVLKASERAALLTRQLLAFGRKQVLLLEVVDLNQVLTEMEKMLRRLIGEDVELVHVLAPDLGLVKTDLGQFGQVIMNLVINARDAMSEGGRLTLATANVELDAEYAARYPDVVAGGYVVVTVADTGIGMDAPTVARLFEPFFTTKSPEKGTGLGLSTAYGIVKQSGGHIVVDSTPGKGSTFKVYLPRETAASAPTAEKPPSAPLRSKGEETILLVEDEDALRQLTTMLLEGAGYRVLSAADGEQALLASERYEGSIALLLTDVVMPRMGGRHLAERLLESRPMLKILFMSGYTDDAILRHGAMGIGLRFLPKPFTEADLTRKIRAVLDGTVTSSAADLAAIVEPTDEPAFDHRELGMLAPDVLARLRTAAVAARYGDLIELIELVGRTQPSVAVVLRQLTDRFDYDGIRALLR
jgi:two-component system, cell cycle sensor histidine kinase and response regulator CckA